MKRISGIVAVLLATATLMGCANVQGWAYEADAPTTRAPVLAKKVVVPPLTDLRASENDRMMFLLIAFPLVPYDSEEYNRPERLYMWESYGIEPCKPTRVVAKAIAEELDHSGLFSEVVYSSDTEGGELVLNGELITLKDRRWRTFYGLGGLGLDLWLLGAPVGQTTNELTLKLTLVEQASGKVLWSETFSERDKQTEWIYALKLTLRHPELLKTELRQAIASLETALSQ